MAWYWWLIVGEAWVVCLWIVQEEVAAMLDEIGRGVDRALRGFGDARHRVRRSLGR